VKDQQQMDKELLKLTVLHLQQQVDSAKGKAKDILSTLDALQPILRNLVLRISQGE